MDYKEKYMRALSACYATRGEAVSGVVKANVSLGLMKGAEHFLSDLHGEHEALVHVLRSASGLIRERIERLFADVADGCLRAQLRALIYYPEEKLQKVHRDGDILDYGRIYRMMLELCRSFSEKYTEKEKGARIDRAAGEHGETVREMIAAYERGGDERLSAVTAAIEACDASDEVLTALSRTVRRLAVDRVHIVGDIFDRGARADLIIDTLAEEETVDVQWGNHDVLWIGASVGIAASVATAVHNSLTYGNIEILEIGYGISLRSLYEFAKETYSECELSIYEPRCDREMTESERRNIALMNKAISVVRFKLEGAAIRRNPDFGMDGSLLLDKIDRVNRTVRIDGEEVGLRESFFPTLDPDNAYRLSEGEAAVMEDLCRAFRTSERLSSQVNFLLRVGGAYKVYNGNLLFHGGIPMTEDGEFMKLSALGGTSGRELMDRADATVRECVKSGAGDGRVADLCWFLWCGRNSPLSARERTRAFERLLTTDTKNHKEKRNAYYKAWQSEEIAKKILREFGLYGARSRIINGHIPQVKGEDPRKAGGRLIVIDGGFCHAFLERTGIGGYTLTYNARGMHLRAHKPFPGADRIIEEDIDVMQDSISVFECEEKLKVRETDRGAELREEITDIIDLILHT